jgi:hypothetical protein
MPSVIYQVIGVVLVLVAILFVPRNLRRYEAGELPIGWDPQRTPTVVLGWRGIILSYFMSGMILLLAGESGRKPALLVLTLAMSFFLLVPCKFRCFNYGRGRWLRNTFFLLLILALLILYRIW